MIEVVNGQESHTLTLLSLLLYVTCRAWTSHISIKSYWTHAEKFLMDTWRKSSKFTRELFPQNTGLLKTNLGEFLEGISYQEPRVYVNTSLYQLSPGVFTFSFPCPAYLPHQGLCKASCSPSLSILSISCPFILSFSGLARKHA